MSDKRNQRGLGRGLSALLADVSKPDEATDNRARTEQIFVDIDRVKPNPEQPRRRFNEDHLEELTRSIVAKGVIQPLIVREKDGDYEIVAGERRWRASQRAQIQKIPVVIRNYSDVEVLEIALIENIQRQELNAVEEAEAFQHLMEKFGHTQEALASAMGKSRSHIANMLRLNGLPDGVKNMLRDEKLSMGHARALLAAPDIEGLAYKVTSQGLSVRDTESLVRKALEPIKEKIAKTKSQRSADTQMLEHDLSVALAMNVRLEHGLKGNGKVVIRYKNLEELDRLIAILNSNQ